MTENQGVIGRKALSEMEQKEKRAAQPPPLESPGLNPLVITCEIPAVEPQIAAKLQVVAEWCATLTVAVEKATVERGEAQRPGGAAMSARNKRSKMEGSTRRWRSFGPRDC